MGSAKHSGRSTKRSRPWTPGRIVGASVWGLVTSTVVAWFLLVAIVEASSLFGDPPDEGRLTNSAANMLLAGALGAAGPLGVWILRRTRPWLIAAGWLLGAAMISAALIRYT